MLGRALKHLKDDRLCRPALGLKTANARKGIETQTGIVDHLIPDDSPRFRLKTANARKGIETQTDSTDESA